MAAHPNARDRGHRPSSARTPAATSLARAFAAAAKRLRPVLEGASLASADRVAESEESAALRAQVHELVYGTLRRYGEGDAIIAHLVDRVLDPEVRALLLVALYRLTTSPDDIHTSVDQAVDAAPLAGCGRAGGLINAVLRGFLRRREELLAAIAQDESVAHAHPDWWLRRLKAVWPGDWAEIVAADNRQPPITLRINRCRQSVANAVDAIREAGVAAMPAEAAVTWWPAAVRVESPGRIDRLPGFAEGHFSVQDPGAQRAAILLDAQPGQRVLDACAAPGGKTAHLLENADLDLIAVELDATRARLIADNLDRLGLRERATVVVGDAGATKDWWDGAAYDRILADVPCTASGVVRRHPDAKWIRRESDIAGFTMQQRRILEALWPLLKPGGRLLYATCSLFSEENDQQVDAFLNGHADARALNRERWRPDPNHDGFFYALLEKR